MPGIWPETAPQFWARGSPSLLAFVARTRVSCLQQRSRQGRESFVACVSALCSSLCVRSAVILGMDHGAVSGGRRWEGRARGADAKSPNKAKTARMAVEVPVGTGEILQTKPLPPAQPSEMAQTDPSVPNPTRQARQTKPPIAVRTLRTRGNEVTGRSVRWNARTKPPAGRGGFGCRLKRPFARGRVLVSGNRPEPRSVYGAGESGRMSGRVWASSALRSASPIRYGAGGDAGDEPVMVGLAGARPGSVRMARQRSSSGWGPLSWHRDATRRGEYHGT